MNPANTAIFLLNCDLPNSLEQARETQFCLPALQMA